MLVHGDQSAAAEATGCERADIGMAGSGLVRKAFARLPDSLRRDVRRVHTEMRGLGQLKRNQALLAQRVAQLEEAQGWFPQTEPTEDPRFPPHVRSRLCTQAQLRDPWFAKWCAAFKEPPLVNRKYWEFAYIAEVLDSLGMLEEGQRGLGFGVGRDPLASLFASRGAHIVATDLDPVAREAGGWAATGQHALELEGVLKPEILDEATFRERVSWRPVDMRNIPSDLRGFDFCWSACALEHLGTLAYGLEFIEQSLATLKPGGIAIHTTEYNLSSNDDTVESGAAVVYRQRDMISLAERLERAGHEVATFDFSPGDGLLDHYVDVPPFADEPVLRFLFASYTLTSVAIVIRAKA
jgi:SAM-dependent methyltransferase